MSDLIDRQEVIRRMCEEDCKGYCGVPCEDYRIVNEVPAVNQWIRCSEKLPESSDKVLCCDEYGEYLIGHVYKDDTSDTGYSADDYEGCKMGDCVAWMTLPGPWKEGSDETSD